MSVFDDKPISYGCVVGSHQRCEMGLCECDCHNYLKDTNEWYIDEKTISYRCRVGRHETCEVWKDRHSCSFNDRANFRCQCECHNVE